MKRITKLIFVIYILLAVTIMSLPLYAYARMIDLMVYVSSRRDKRNDIEND